MIGDQVSHYRVVRALGSGGMGEVFLAIDTRLDRRVALKFVRSSLLAESASRARFLREARLVAALSHPGIAVVYDVGQADGRPFLAMEYLDGHDLAMELAAGPLEAERLVDFGGQIAEALDYAHRQGIIHRDIKASNVMVIEGGRLKLLDFGVATHVTADTEAATPTASGIAGIVGTLRYCAPEVLSGQPADVRSDIYSFGALLYEMACGRPPFDDADTAVLLARILRGDAAPVQRFNGAVPSAIGDVIRRAMALSSEERYPTPTAVADALRAAADRPSGARLHARAESRLLAVLAFENLSHDPASDWVGTGLAETLTSDLQRLRTVDVVSRERVEQTARRLSADADPTSVGQALRAHWVVSGGYQHAGPRIRITARVTDISTGRVAASAKVDGVWDEVFDLQDKVVQELLGGLRVDVDADAARRIAEQPAPLLGAWEAYASGRAAVYRMERGALEESRRHYERALAIDETYAPAHAGLGFALTLRYLSLNDPSDLEESVAHLERAVGLDPNLGEAFTHLCYAYARQHKMDQALQAGRRAVSIIPQDSRAWYFFGVVNILDIPRGRDRMPRAVECTQTAARLAPRNMPAWGNLGTLAIQSGRYDLALRAADIVDTLTRSGTGESPFPGFAAVVRGEASLRAGALEAACSHFRQSADIWRASTHVYRNVSAATSHAMLAGALVRQDNTAAAVAELDAAEGLLDNRRETAIGQLFLARIWSERAIVRQQIGDAAEAADLRRRVLSVLVSAAPRPGDASPATGVWTTDLYHGLSRAAAVAGDRQAALDALVQAIFAGWRDAAWLEADPQLAPIRTADRFAALLAELRATPPLVFSPF